jgi:hypothetical protein
MNLWVSASPGRAPWHHVASGKSRKALEATAKEIGSTVSGPVFTTILEDGFIPDGTRPDTDYGNSTTFWWVYWDRARVRNDKAAMSRAAKELRRLGVTVALAGRRPALRIA